MVWSALADSFGNTSVDGAATITNNLRFAGQYFDAETGLHYNGSRYYDPLIGRYLSEDPIGVNGGMNLYAYVNGNPVNWIDPYGLFSVTDLPTFPQPVVDFAACFGDFISSGFGLFDTSLSQKARQAINADSVVNKCSDACGYGKNSGVGLSFLMGGAAIARGFGWVVRFDRYANAGGGGMNILRYGERKFAIDWHKFKLGGKNGKMVNRPHYHRGTTKSQMKKHRPWEGGF
ncbi:MAG: RHS repeat-associated core domain-containing protein [Gammaproteobacteria bacterium]|nr:RHS repeat-associated core domain-containing protein [Gammaproteobacteria bacterium]